MKVISYLNFEGRTDEALAFYAQAVGARPGMVMRFKDAPEPPPPGSPPMQADKVMHCDFTVGDTTIMASDGYCMGSAEFKGVTLTLSVDTEEESRRYFAALSEGGKVTMPLAKTFFSPSFGMLTDKFGLGWIVIVSVAP